MVRLMAYVSGVRTTKSTKSSVFLHYQLPNLQIPREFSVQRLKNLLEVTWYILVTALCLFHEAVRGVVLTLSKLCLITINLSHTPIFWSLDLFGQDPYQYSNILDSKTCTHGRTYQTTCFLHKSKK